MRNPEATKYTIIVEGAYLFNTQGYKATSLSDITKRTGLTKGAIYRHFKDKSELEKECLKYLCYTMVKDVGINIRKAKNSKAKLLAVLKYFDCYREKAPFEGGCPLMNAAVEVDDSNKELKLVVQEIMTTFVETIIIILQNGVKHKQLKKELNVKQFASIIFSQLEGAVMMLKVLDDPKPMKHALTFLKKEIDSHCI